MNDRQEEMAARTLQELESGLTARLEDFRHRAARNRLRAQRKQEKALIEREAHKARAVFLRSGGRSGVRICARLGIGRETLARWFRQDAAFRACYDAVYNAWKDGDDGAIKVLLKAYRPDKQALTVETRRRSGLNDSPGESQARAG